MCQFLFHFKVGNLRPKPRGSLCSTLVGLTLTLLHSWLAVQTKIICYALTRTKQTKVDIVLQQIWFWRYGTVCISNTNSASIDFFRYFLLIYVSLSARLRQIVVLCRGDWCIGCVRWVVEVVLNWGRMHDGINTQNVTHCVRLLTVRIIP